MSETTPKPYKMTPERVAIILEALGDGMTQRDASMLAGISEDTLCLWKEGEIEKLQKQIEQAKTQRNKMELEEMDVVDFTRWVKNIVEHPKEILADIESEQELLHMYSLFFMDFPTYSQIVSGTPKMSLVFRLSDEFKVDESAFVTPRGIEPRFQP